MQFEEIAQLAQIISAHPKFPDASRAFVRDYTVWREGLSTSNRIFSDLARFNLVTQLMFIHYAAKREGKPSPATFSRLCELAANAGLRERAIRTTLQLMQTAGLVVMRRGDSDLRKHVFEPTPRLDEIARGYQDAVFGVFDHLAPEARLREKLREDPEFGKQYLGRLGAAYVEVGHGLLSQAGPMSKLVLYDGANPLVAAIIDHHYRGERLPTLAELASRFKVSQTQVRNVLNAAAKLGLVTLAARSRLVDVAPLEKAYFETYCLFFAFYARFGLEMDVAALAA